MANEELMDKLRHWIFEDDIFNSLIAWATQRIQGIDITNDEHKLEYTELHKEYETFFESKLEKFVLNAGTTPEDLLSELEKQIAAEPQGDAAQMVEFLTASADYDVFLSMMKDVAKQQKAASSSSSTDGSSSTEEMNGSSSTNGDNNNTNI